MVKLLHSSSLKLCAMSHYLVHKGLCSTPAISILKELRYYSTDICQIYLSKRKNSELSIISSDFVTSFFISNIRRLDNLEKSVISQ